MSEIKNILNPDNKEEDKKSSSNGWQFIIIAVLVGALFWTNRDSSPGPEPGPGPDPGPTPNNLEVEVSEGVRSFIIQYNENLSEATGLLAEKLKNQEFKDTDEFRVLAREYTEEARVDATKQTIDAVMDEYIEPGDLAGRESGDLLMRILEVQSKTHEEIAGDLK